MKKMFAYLCMMMIIVVIPMSCKDDDAAPVRELMLSKIIRDEIMLMDFVYDEQKIIRANLYDNDGDISHYTRYVYDDEGIFASFQYNENDIVESKVTFTHNESGQITKGEIYSEDSDFTEVYGTVTFSYNESGQLASMGVAALGQPEYVLDEFTYDVRGHRVQLTRSAYPDDPEDEYVSYEIDYTPADKLIPSHWNDFAFLLMTFDVDVYLLDMFNVSSHRTSWSSNGKVNAESRTDGSNQQFNPDGYLISQTLKRISLSGLSPQQTDEMTYEYVE